MLSAQSSSQWEVVNRGISLSIAAPGLARESQQSNKESLGFCTHIVHTKSSFLVGLRLGHQLAVVQDCIYRSPARSLRGRAGGEQGGEQGKDQHIP